MTPRLVGVTGPLDMLAEFLQFLRMKTCAACGESVLATATRCKFCTSAV